MAKSLPVSTREELLNRVLRQKIPVAQACREFGISRFTYYKWLKRYEDGKGLKDKPRKVEEFWRQATPQQEELVLKVVVENPTLSKYKIAERLREITGQPILGPHGVYNVLRRWSLTLPEARLAYVQRMAPAVQPVTWVPTAKAFLASLASSSILSLAFLFWLQMVSRHPFQTQLGLIFASISLSCGTFFFLYSMKYYFTLAVVLSFSRQPQEEGGGYALTFNGRLNNNQKNNNGWLARIFGLNGSLRGPTSLKSSTEVGPPQVPAGGLQPSLDHIKLERYPFISVHLPLYNEKKVANRILSACTAFDYPNYEVVVVDDSTDETTTIVQKFAEQWNKQINTKKPIIKVIHRPTREGFKGGALGEALRHTNPKAEFVVVFDADFIPYQDTLELFIKYFKVNNNTSEDYTKNNLACVAGYQWHVLNKSENWITRGVRAEYAGSYVIERPGQEILGAIRLIHGSVYCLRADILKKFGWGTSITEDFELTLKLYEAGYKVIYTPYVQAPAECASTLKRLIRQRMRWAEGHSNNIRRMFFRLIRSPKLTLPEKLEVLYLSPYYLQAFFFLVGTLSWLLAETVFRARLPFWTSLWGWSLVLTNFFSLPLVNAVGLFLEEAEEKDYLGLFSFIFLSYLLVPFQAYASVKGFLEKEEGPWFRTPKTGRITDIFTRGKFYRWISGILPGRIAPARISTDQLRMSTDISANQFPISANPYIALATANSRFENFRISKKSIRGISVSLLAILLLISSTLVYLTPTISPFRLEPDESRVFGMLAGPQGNLTQTGKSINGAYSDGSNLEELKPKEISPSAYAFKTLDDSVIEIGTEKHSPPQPYLKLNKWDGEVSLKVDIPFITEEKPLLIGDKIRYSTVNDQRTKNSNWWQKILFKLLPFARASTENQPKIDIEFYPREPEQITEIDAQGNEHKFTINEHGGVEFDTILYEKPETNQIVFPIETKGLKFYYQPELTQKEIDEGAFRPENVVGSYAVYHESKQGDYTALGGKNYRAGKAFHIYRPKITDANGNEIWGELNIPETCNLKPKTCNLTITIDQDWLDNAVYPVTIDPRFGYETAGGSYYELYGSGIVQGSVFTMGATAGTADSMTVYTLDPFGSPASKGAIYQHSNSDLIDNGITEEKILSATGWVTHNFVGTKPSLTASTEYVLTELGEAVKYNKEPRIAFDTGDTDQRHTQGATYPTFPDPATFTHGNIKSSIYATYTAKIDTSTSSSPTAYSFQRKTWYDGTRLWSAFYSGTEIEFWYSADWGSTWTQNTSATIAVSTNDFSIEADSSNAFIVYYSPLYDIAARSATSYPGTGFSWGTATFVYDGGATSFYNYPTIARDSNNKIWVTAKNTSSGTDFLFKAIQSTTDNDISDWGTATTLDTSTNSNKYGTIVPLSDGEMYAVWIDGTTIEGKKYASYTVDKQVAVGADDGRRHTGSDGFSATENPNLVGYYADSHSLAMHGFARWTGVTIEGTIGANSYIQCYAQNSGALTPELKVYGVDEDNPAAPTTYGQFDADPLTTAAVDWDGAWTINEWAQSGSLAAIFQELVDTYAISNEAVMVQIKNDHAGTGNEYNGIRSWEYPGNLHGPKLHIEYTAWDSSPTTIATGGTGMSNNMSAVADSSGNVHLLYIANFEPPLVDYVAYKKYTTSWQTEVTLDGTSGCDYPTISINTANNDLYAIWVRSNVIYYKKGVSPYASANWDASATSWKAAGTNTYTTSNYSGAGMIYALWTEGTASPYSVNWDYVIIPENLVALLFMGLVIPKLLRKKKVGYRGFRV